MKMTKKKVIIISAIAVVAVAAVATTLILINKFKTAPVYCNTEYAMSFTISDTNGLYYRGADENGLMHFFDYNTKNDVILCSRPNCKHDDRKTCDANYPNGAVVVGKMNNTIYLLCFDDYNTGILYKENEDGTNRSEVMKINTQPGMTAVLHDNCIYYCGKIEKLDEAKHPTGETNCTIHKIDLASKKDTVVSKEYKGLSGGLTIAGIYKDKIYYEYADFKEKFDITNVKENDIMNYIKNSFDRQEIYELDLASGKEKRILTNLKAKQVECTHLYKNFLYCICEDDSNAKIIQYNIDTSSTETIANKPGSLTIDGVFDNKVFISSNKNKVRTNFYYNINSKDTKGINLTTKDNTKIKIMAESNDIFVLDLENMNDEAKSSYAYINKSDFYAENFNTTPLSKN